MEVTLHAERRASIGSAAARRLRREAKVPAVAYGQDRESTPVLVDSRDLSAVLHTDAGLNVLISLEIDGEGSHLTLPRSVQRHPVRNQILHVDFVKISLTETVEAEVPVELTGDPQSVRDGDAVVEHIRNVVRVRALPRDVPAHVTVDISHLELGDVLRVADLPRLDGVEYLDEGADPIASVAVPRLEVEEAVPEEEAEELEEGEVPAEAEAEEAPEGEAPEEPA
jgi:large subunit ribosomal protein L25